MVGQREHNKKHVMRMGMLALVGMLVFALVQILGPHYVFASSNNATSSQYESSTAQNSSLSEAAEIRVLWQDVDGQPLDEASIPQEAVVLELKNNDEQLNPRKLITVRARDGWVAELDEALSHQALYCVVENKQPKGFEAISDGLTLINRKKPPQTPEIEFYVNQDVHANTVEFDRVFRYQALAYVPSDATAIEISNTLPQELHFVSSEEDIAKTAVAIDGLDHKAASVITDFSNRAIDVKGEPVKADVSIDGQNLTVRIGNIGNVMGMQRLRERAVRLSFAVQLNDDITQLNQLNYQDVEDNGCVESIYSSHAGVVNQASYTIEINNKGESKPGYQNITSNHVSFMPQDVTVAAEVSWANLTEEGTLAPIEWPTQLSSVDVDLLRITTVLDKAGKPLIDANGLAKTNTTVVDSLSLAPGETYVEFAQQPKLCYTRYEVVESSSAGFILETDSERTKAGKVIHSMVNKPETPELELYVNYGSNYEFACFDESFEYEIMAYVPQGTQSFTISDQLPFAVELLDKDAIKIYDMGKQTNNHIDSVLWDGTEIDADAADIKDSSVSLVFADAQPYQGHWLKLTLEAHIKPDAYESVAAHINEKNTTGVVADIDGVWANVLTNGTLATTQTHDGVPNRAQYSLQFEDNQSYVHESNIATIKPSVMATSVEQVFEQGWPEAVPSVQAELTYADSTQTLTLTHENPKQISQGMPRVSGAQPQVKLTSLAGYNSVVYGNEADGFTIESTAKYFPVCIFKVDHEGGEIPGAILELKGGPDNLVEVWTSGEQPKKLRLKAGQYQLTELVSPEDYETLDGTLEFVIDDAGAISFTQASNAANKVHLEGHDCIMLSNEPLSPQIEAYVNADVHADIVEFDRSFRYDIVAFVPANASTVEIEDVLPSCLEFVDDAQTIADGVQLRTGNSHRAGSTNVATGEVPDASVSVQGQKLTLQLNDVSAARGKYMQFSAHAKIKDTIRTLEGLGGLTTVTNNGQVVSSLNLASGNTAASHSGVANSVQYQISLAEGLGETSSETLSSNVVTIIPELSSIPLKAHWVDVNGQTLPWPAGAKVTAKLLGKGGSVVQTSELTSDQLVTLTVPKLEGVNYKLSSPNVVNGPSSAEAKLVGNAQDGYEIVVRLPQEAVFNSVAVPITAYVELEGEGATLAANDYELQLEGANIEVRATNDDSGFVDFGDFEFDAPGTYSLIITGIAKGDSSIAYDTQAHSALVTVKKDIATNTLTAEVSYDGADSLTVTHKKIPLPGAIVDLSSTVSLNTNSSEVLLNSLVGNFSFELFDSAGTIVATATNNETGSITFPPIVFGQAGDYSYTMRQRAGSDSAIGYDMSEHSFNVHVRSEDSNYRLVAEIENFAGNAFINSYVGPQIVEVSVLDRRKDAQENTNTETSTNESKQKELSGARFELKDAEGNTIKSWISGSNPESFELSGGHYTLVEQAPPDGYRSLGKAVDFTVTDAGELILENNEPDDARVSAKGGRIELSYTANPTVSIARQSVSGSALAGSSLRITGEGASYSWLSLSKPHELTLKPGRYELSELAAPQGHGRLMSQVAFTLNPDATVTVDSVPVVGARLSAQGSQLTLVTAETPRVALSRVDVNGDAVAGSRLELKGADNELIDSWTTAHQAYEMELPIGNYSIEERVAAEGYQRMTGALNFSVNDDGSVSLLGMSGQGSVAIVQDNLITLEALPISEVVIMGHVLFDEVGIVIPPEEGRFSFDLIDGTGRTLETVSNNADGSFTFSELHFTEPGTYNFFVEQQWLDNYGDGTGIAYDPHRAEINVEVKRGAGSELIATVHSAADELLFESALEPHSEVQLSDNVASLSFKTMLDAKDAHEPGTFTLRLEGTSVNAQGMSFEASNDSEGNVNFDAIAFAKPGIYEFELYELEGDKPNIGYDKSKYDVSIRVSKAADAIDSKMSLECWATNSLGHDVNPGNIGFANTDRTPAEYVVPAESHQTAPVDLPQGPGPRVLDHRHGTVAVAQTGDVTDFNLMLLLGLGGIVLVGVAAFVLKRRASDEQAER
ncbi:MAG: isopeptide-forming domain-containing fimbrial protein [Atopobiaceae bacterium]|nr:isopeptide-forming domain-containing fimbrial protein [Atopobiaceae bacterium]